jgi:hypothetical protein
VPSAIKASKHFAVSHVIARCAADAAGNNNTQAGFILIRVELQDQALTELDDFCSGTTFC